MLDYRDDIQQVTETTHSPGLCMWVVSPTCGTDAPQIKQSPRPSSGNPVSRCIFFFLSFFSFFFFPFQSGTILLGVGSHPTGSSALTGLAFPPETARHTPLHNQCPMLSGATISGSKPQTQVWDPFWSVQPGQRRAPQLGSHA